MPVSRLPSPLAEEGHGEGSQSIGFNSIPSAERKLTYLPPLIVESMGDEG